MKMRFYCSDADDERYYLLCLVGSDDVGMRKKTERRLEQEGRKSWSGGVAAAKISGR